MRKLLVILVLLAAGLGACKKDYPKDIPDWLEDHIKKLKKKTKSTTDCYYGLCLHVDEYSNGSETIFWVLLGGTPEAYSIYDYEGVNRCLHRPIECLIGYDTCGIYGDNCFQDYTVVRRIWEEIKH